MGRELINKPAVDLVLCLSSPTLMLLMCDNNSNVRSTIVYLLLRAEQLIWLVVVTTIEIEC